MVSLAESVREKLSIAFVYTPYILFQSAMGTVTSY